jgi:hypothetical protein
MSKKNTVAPSPEGNAASSSDSSFSHAFSPDSSAIKELYNVPDFSSRLMFLNSLSKLSSLSINEQKKKIISQINKILFDYISVEENFNSIDNECINLIERAIKLERDIQIKVNDTGLEMNIKEYLLTIGEMGKNFFTEEVAVESLEVLNGAKDKNDNSSLNVSVSAFNIENNSFGEREQRRQKDSGKNKGCCTIL